MNFLNSVCFYRYGRAGFWSAPCVCRDSVKTAALALTQNNNSEFSLAEETKLKNLLRNVCHKNSSPILRPALWTQVRFNKSIPRFHRDLEYPNFDDYRKNQFIDVRKTSWGQGDEKVGASYALAFAGGCVGMYAAKTVVTHFITYMSAAADVLALASVEVELKKIAPGGCDIVKWRGKPLFIKNRTQTEIDAEKNTAVESLRDPEPESARTQKPEWLVVIGICTHLGCVPIANTGDHVGGFYCPCHGSHYDNLGRIRKGPAPTNLVIPPYTFISDTQITVG